jgi:hypothetical protein
MNISIDLHNLSLVNVNFLDTKRNIIMDGNFTKIVYSNQYFTMNSIYLDFPIEWQTIDRVLNKKFVRFNPYNPKNLSIIQDIAKIEARILEYFRTYCKINVKIMNSLSKQMYSGNMKIFQEYSQGLKSPTTNLVGGFQPPDKFGHPQSNFPTVSSNDCVTTLSGNQERSIDYLDEKDNTFFVIKLSGIWENYQEIGITYKLLQQSA